VIFQHVVTIFSISKPQPRYPENRPWGGHWNRGRRRRRRRLRRWVLSISSQKVVNTTRVRPTYKFVGATHAVSLWCCTFGQPSVILNCACQKIQPVWEVGGSVSFFLDFVESLSNVVRLRWKVIHISRFLCWWVAFRTAVGMRSSLECPSHVYPCTWFETSGKDNGSRVRTIETNLTTR